MKHKGQEALNSIVKSSCKNGGEEGCQDCSMSGICNSLAKTWVEQMQQMIDCQLTKDELGILIPIYQMFCKKNKTCHESISNKLIKQKYMWEETK